MYTPWCGYRQDKSAVTPFYLCPFDFYLSDFARRYVYRACYAVISRHSPSPCWTRCISIRGHFALAPQPSSADFTVAEVDTKSCVGDVICVQRSRPERQNFAVLRARARGFAPRGRGRPRALREFTRVSAAQRFYCRGLSNPEIASFRQSAVAVSDIRGLVTCLGLVYRSGGGVGAKMGWTLRADSQIEVEGWIRAIPHWSLSSFTCRYTARCGKVSTPDLG